MSKFLRCETCHADVECNDGWPDGWIETETNGVPMLHHCSWRCLGEFATARALIDSAGES